MKTYTNTKDLVRVLILSFFLFHFSNCNIFSKLERGLEPLSKLILSLFSNNTQLAVTSVLPTNNSTDNVVNTGIYVVFNSNIEGEESIVCNVSSDGGVTNHPGTIVIASNLLTFTPTGNFSDNTTYTVTVSGGKLSAPYSFAFTTNATVDNTAPFVSETTPLTGSTDIRINTSILIVFNETIAPSSLATDTITVTGGVTGTTSLNGNSILFQPNAYLAANTIYAVTVKLGLKDLAGNTLSSNYSFTFTSGATIGEICRFDNPIYLFDACYFE